MKYLILFLFCLTAQADISRELNWFEKNFGAINNPGPKRPGQGFDFLTSRLTLTATFDKEGICTTFDAWPRVPKTKSISTAQLSEVKTFLGDAETRRYSVRYYGSGGKTICRITIDRQWMIMFVYKADGKTLARVKFTRMRKSFIEHQND